MKYLHLYTDTSYCESESFKDTPNTIAIEDEIYSQLGRTKKFKDGIIVDMTQEELKEKQKWFKNFSTETNL